MSQRGGDQHPRVCKGKQPPGVDQHHGGDPNTRGSPDGRMHTQQYGNKRQTPNHM